MLTSLQASLLALTLAAALPFLARVAPLGSPLDSLGARVAGWLGARQPGRRVTFRNKSKLLADVYLDRGFPPGELRGTLEPKRGRLDLDCRPDDRFFFTRHGSLEQLVDEGGRRIEATVLEAGEVVLRKGAQTQGLRCLDRYPRFCEFQAQRGECALQPGWMVINCCASCDEIINASALVDPKVRCRRGTLNTSGTRAWAAGDLERLFARVGGNETWAPYAPRILKSLTSEEVDTLVAHGERLGFRRSAIQGDVDLGEVGDGRTSGTAWCSDEPCMEDGVLRGLKQKVEQLIGIPQRNFNALQLLHYDEGQYYRRHYDVTPGDKISTSAAGPRVLTLLLFLTDVAKGGATVFPKLGVRFAPRRGAALLWANVLNRAPEEVDMRMEHEAAAVKKGVKKAANLWVHLYDYQKSFAWGCT